MESSKAGRVIIIANKQEDLSSVGGGPLSPRGTLRKFFQLVGIEFTTSGHERPLLEPDSCTHHG